MAIERRNPLPANNQRYWVDVEPIDRIPFYAWLAAYKDAVKVITSQTSDLPDRDDWILFEVQAPGVFWVPLRGSVWPNTADSSIKTKADTETAPDVDAETAAVGKDFVKEIAPWAVVTLLGIALIKRLLP